MWDEQSYSTDSLSSDSWLFDVLLVGVRREVVRLWSYVTKVVRLRSEP